MDFRTIAANVRDFRFAMDLTQAQLAARAGVTLAQYRSIERGASEPSVDRLMRVADALRISVRELFRPRPRLAHARFRAAGRMPRRFDIVAAVSRQLDADAELRKILARLTGSSRRHSTLGRIRAALARRRDRDGAAEAMARRARRALGLGDRPVRDLCGLLEAHGVQILTPEFPVAGFVGLSVREFPRGDAIVVNTWNRYPVEQWIFTAARELGHLILHAETYDVHDARPLRDEEMEADRFASEFLMPDVVFVRQWEALRDRSLVERVLAVKRIFAVGWRTVLHRIERWPALQLRGTVWAKFHAECRETFGHAFDSVGEPDSVSADAFDANRPDAPTSGSRADRAQFGFTNDRLTRRARLAYDRGLISIDRFAQIAEIPLAEARAMVNADAYGRSGTRRSADRSEQLRPSG